MEANRVLMATRKGLIVFERAAGGWKLASEHFSEARVSYACVDPRTGLLWACLDHGHWGAKLHRSRDCGQTFEEIDLPAYPPGEQMRSHTGLESAARLYRVWALEAGGTGQPGRLYLGTEPGGLFISDDDGTSWELSRGLWDHPSRREEWAGAGTEYPALHSIVVDPRDADRLYVAISCGGVFETADGGASWVPRNRGISSSFLPNPTAEVGHDPHCLVQCTARPDVLWQQNHCGIFRSDDAAATWQEIAATEETFGWGFPIAVDPEDPERAWVVPMDPSRTAPGRALAVYRTENGGGSWQALRRGLPQEHCYDLILRHGLDLHGDRLVMGSSTGNARLSEDRGDSWISLGTHLPPIHAARFA